MNITVAFPYRDTGCKWRQWSFPFVQSQYLEILPGVTQLICDSEHEVFNRAASRNLCVNSSKDGVVILADTDILPEKEGLLSAIQAAKRGGIHIPFDKYRALSEEGTLKYYDDGYDRAHASAYPTQWELRAPKFTAGILVVRNDVWWSVGGMDEGFINYAYEDTAFSCVVDTFLGGINYHRSTVNHLYHPSGANPKDKYHKLNKIRYEKYLSAKGDKSRMRMLVKSLTRKEVNV